MIAKCSCKHPGQDKLHGPGMRVMNESKKGLRCTVCGSDRDAPRKEKE